ncbi:MULTISPECIES: L7Ae/L30e/S12e/Gadd45 family ribosomal protein [Eubacterium]|jgi:ribosomal protein L7Ae-like RNA K-turn-binding protein|uniref:Ribosomal protein L7Ae n=1 Tax=Eubacterium ruminantium TaxID=42322 RepID=A0A1T4MF27_9FIRM|nr:MULTISPECIES: ribosomal L7Ae/L30e/S12e/Gadd45 family protein [Eubacterium]MCR5367865.1 ribosomal L7Ae/L30e/S12e/Gadd45 family protein [Eubacterium sp.]SCW47571.1 Ribosomal protein L7Ae [Eubacterium ruminantium]SDM55411.1 Ribosomal protein L7Ae [Eubacterium ruminantium]SJZ65456.1 Ribosomal protein L7Ae [Eubacterium ruminantium]
MDKRLGMLGLAARAGALVSGGFMAEKAIADGSAKFVIIAEDASDNTVKKFENKCRFYKVPYVICSVMDELGHLIGKESRTVIAITDDNFAEQFIKRFEQQ